MKFRLIIFLFHKIIVTLILELQVTGYKVRVIVGLGNPGTKYQNNRHNVGQMFVDYLIDSRLSTLDFSEKNKKGFFPNLKSIVYYLKSDFILVKPQTFMNKSGEAVKKISKVYGLKSNNLIVAHDDLDIPLGKFKIQKGVGPKLHNGIESIEKTLGRKDFWRVRIGIDNRPAKKPAKKIMYLHHDRGQNTFSLPIDGESYVLQDFNQAEKNLLVNEVFPKIYTRLSSKFLINAPTTTR